MAEFTVTTLIDRPSAEVFAYMTDPAKSARWQSGTQSAEWSSEGPAGVGSVLHSVTRLLGREMTIDAEITRWDPPSVWDMKGAAGPMSFEVSIVLEPANGGTQVTQHFTAEIGGFFSIAEGLAAKQLQKQVTADGQTLKKLLEAG
jgi:carbon monoxide dehydrogenase subunit G